MCETGNLLSHNPSEKLLLLSASLQTASEEVAVEQLCHLHVLYSVTKNNTQ